MKINKEKWLYALGALLVVLGIFGWIAETGTNSGVSVSPVIMGVGLCVMFAGMAVKIERVERESKERDAEGG